MNVYETVKGNIGIRLANANKAEDGFVWKSAEEYGFDDIIMIPYIYIGKKEDEYVTSKVTAEMIEDWGVTEDEVFAKGIENTDYKIESMRSMLLGLMGLEPDDPIADIMCPDTPGMYVVTNGNAFLGASAILKAKEELNAMFPEGYTVLPSSIHEVIVIPNTDEVGSENDLKGIVGEVNGTVLDDKDYLADNVYRFVA